jgi:hypothetical protein
MDGPLSGKCTAPTQVLVRCKVPVRPDGNCELLATPTAATICAQVSFALAKAASGAAAKRGTKRKADGEAASPEPVSALLPL